jgi:hypothetical protein
VYGNALGRVRENSSSRHEEHRGIREMFGRDSLKLRVENALDAIDALD